MKSLRWKALFVVALVLTGALLAPAEETAAQKFNNTYRLVIRADIARDAGDHAAALELYTRAYNEYAGLTQDYPDWQPGATRFRLEHCGREIVRIRQLQEQGLISESSPIAADTPRSGEDLPAVTDYENSGAVVRLAAALLERDRIDAARECVMKGLEQRPRHPQLTMMLAAIQCRTGHFEGSLLRLRELVGDHPDDPTLRVLLATTYYGLGEEAGAASELKRALKLDPVMTEAHYNLAQVLLNMSPPDLNGARHHYHKCVQLGGERDAALASRLQSAGVTPSAAGSGDAAVPVVVPASNGAASPPAEEDAGQEPEARKSWLRSLLPW